MAEDIILDIEIVKKRAVIGVVTLVLRTFFIQTFTFLSIFILTVILEPSIFGVFFLVSAIINFFVYFSDVGLAAALIQKKEELTKKDLSSTFTIQQIIVISLTTLGLLASGQIANFYNLDSDGLFLLRVLVFSLFLSSLKTIPSILLERKLSFGKLIIPQIAENVVFYTTAIILAQNNFGIASFTWAVLLRGIIGLILIYLISPWKPSLAIDRAISKKLISFGVPFQLNSILALLKDDLLTILLGKILSFTQIGYLGWAQKWSFTPLRFFMDNLIKVTFPAYSRLQNDKIHLKKAIEKSLFFVTFTVYPSVVGIIVIAPLIVNLIPKYQKWEAALPLLYFYGVNAIFAAVNTTLTNILFALGKPKIILKLMVFWTALTWLLTFVLYKLLGFQGVAIASALVAASTSITVYFVKKEVDISVINSIKIPFFASLTMFIMLMVLKDLLSVNVLSLLTLIILGGGLYFGISLAFYRSRLLLDLKTIISAVFKKS